MKVLAIIFIFIVAMALLPRIGLMLAGAALGLLESISSLLRRIFGRLQGWMKKRGKCNTCGKLLWLPFGADHSL